MITSEFIRGAAAAFDAVNACLESYQKATSQEHKTSPEYLEALNVYLDCLISVSALTKTTPQQFRQPGSLLDQQITAILDKVE